MKHIIYLFIITTLFTTKSGAHSLHAHVHGKVNLDMVTDKYDIALALRTTSDAILGFEHKPKTKKQIEMINRIKKEWNQNVKNYFGPQALNDCKIKTSNWEQKFSGKNHSNIIAEAQLTCEKPIAGRKLEISLINRFKGIRKVNFQLIRGTGVTEKLHFRSKFYKVSL